MRDSLLLALLFAVLVALGGLSPLASDGLTGTEAALAYRLAWEVSTSLEHWSNYLVDGLEEWKPDEAEDNRVFRLVERLISLLCKEMNAHGKACLYSGY